MSKSMLGIIDATIHNEEMQELTLKRSIAAVPFGGRYRLIDFVLSNMVNSGIQNVAIFPRYQYRSLMDHLGSGKQWDLDRKRDGLFFFPSSENENTGSFQHFKENVDFFGRSNQKYVVIANSFTVSNMNYKLILDRHIQNRCDITHVVKEDETLDMYVLEKDLLVKLFMNHEQTGYRSIMDVVEDITSGYKICNYEYTNYAAVIDSLESYYEHSLELLDPVVWKQVFVKDHPVFTKVKDEPPTSYSKDAYVKNSMIANGAIIEGHVENSIIFRGVKIGKGTVVKNSIVMQKGVIGENCVLDSVILDKDVKVEDGTSLTGKTDSPYLVKKGSVQGALMNS
ncbi:MULTISPECIES: GlgC family sugar phosphate nucleotidyltransferase [Bacillaceae]|uniref:Glucose-1-phosphate adenylyltransferase n=1 Tax=Sutcliffiella horikoshii TaxID=79883 RepID=A0A5D4TAY3_9BACI|nr:MULTISPECIES: sugar phosphate nucleotidyltransferase [Bacillaceae]TYS71416.1 glucose-1-phosphate adenylyltransferase [Sutcliffiella horikoshii]